MFGLCCLKFDQKFSLKSLSVNCSVRNLLIACTCEFVYKNEGEDGEGLFSFPLENNSVVYYLEAVIGGKTIIGVCKEVEEAKNMYKVAKESGHMTAMIEQNTSMMDVFKCRIGNFPKNSEAKIILKFAMELKLSLVRSETEGVDRFNLALPLVLRPRYTPSGYDGDREVYQVTNKYEYHFKADITGTKVIHNILSVNHNLLINYTNENKTKAEITLQSEYDGTKDLDINIDYVAMREPSVFFEVGSKSELYTGKEVIGTFYNFDVAMVNFLPQFESTTNENRCKTEIVIVVDRSGSMEGSNIERAKECLLIFLKSLPMNCKFQIYGFGSEFDKAFNDSQLYTDQSISIAMNYQKNLDANFGGTELMRPLQDMYNSPLSSDYNRVAFVLTDGDVGNQDEVINLVKKHNKRTRLFTVGIGDGVSTSLVDKVAKAGLGKSVFVRNASELSASVIELLDIAINSTPFTDAKIDWQCPQHVSIVTAPKSTPPIFSDYFLTVFCMINGMKSGDIIHCTLSGNVNGNRVSFTVDISNANAIVDEEFRVHRLLAKYKIDEMTSEIECEGENMKKSLIDLSLQVNIVTKYTTFVAIDQDAPEKGLTTLSDPEEYAMNISTLSCSLSHGVQLQSAPRRSRMMPTMNMMEKSTACDNIQNLRKKSENKCDNNENIFSDCVYKISDEKENSLSKKIFKAFSSLFKKSNKVSKGGLSFEQITREESKSDAKSIDVIIFLVDQQNINGSWSYSENILAKINVDVTDFQNRKPNETSDEIWLTVLIYQFLVTKEQSREKEWRLVAKKAKQWIENNFTDRELLESVFKRSLELLQ